MNLDSEEVTRQVRQALQEDIGSGDLSAELLPAAVEAQAVVVSRQAAVVCGISWFDCVFRGLDPAVQVHWAVKDGDEVQAEQVLCTLTGPARALVTGERAALNFLQTLSATATLARGYARAVEGFDVRILDTRKTIPGLRLAQKYAVQCGGCANHRMGLYDGILIKENHILAAGSIQQAVAEARRLYPDRAVEVEVENLDEVEQAASAGADILLLDNFDPEQLRGAVKCNAGRARLEASGGVTLETVRDIAATGVDYISVGALTKDIKAVDLSMRFR